MEKLVPNDQYLMNQIFCAELEYNYIYIYDDFLSVIILFMLKIPDLQCIIMLFIFL